MKSKYLLLAFLVMMGYEVVKSHIVTTSHVDLPLLFCMKNLGRIVMTDLCTKYGNTDEVFDSNFPLMPQEIAREANFERITKICCTTPCTISELLTIC